MFSYNIAVEKKSNLNLFSDDMNVLENIHVSGRAEYMLCLGTNKFINQNTAFYRVI